MSFLGISLTFDFCCSFRLGDTRNISIFHLNFISLLLNTIFYWGKEALSIDEEGPVHKINSSIADSSIIQCKSINAVIDAVSTLSATEFSSFNTSLDSARYCVTLWFFKRIIQPVLKDINVNSVILFLEWFNLNLLLFSIYYQFAHIWYFFIT